MAGFPVPEILRVPLESVSLAVKAMREEEDVKVRFPPLVCAPWVLKGIFVIAFFE
jgi:ATP-dependent RNA helicase DHX57